MINEINIVLEAFEGRKTCVHISYKVNGVGYTFTGIDEDDILKPEIDLASWLRSFLISGVVHILDLENEHPVESIQVKFCLFIRDKVTLEAISTKIGIAEVRLVEGGALCKIFYDMIPTILN